MKKKKILTVDDELDFLTVIGERLRQHNYEVVTAVNGIEALEKIASEKPDIVLLDIKMPGEDGLEVLKKIRQKNKNLPVFMVSAYLDKERFEEANRLKASGFISKTGDLDSEVNNITNFLNIAGQYHERDNK
jgi:two-component system response regulator (stage 0 sporulation protein F)